MTINSRFADFSCICESQPLSVFLACSPSLEASVLFWCSAFCHSLNASMPNCSEFCWQWCHWRTLYCNSNLVINNWTFLLSGEIDRDVSDQITWKHERGLNTADVVVSRYTLQASTFQMAILLQYNTEDSYTVQQLTDSTQIKTVSAHTPFKINDCSATHFLSAPDFLMFYLQDILVQVLQILLKSKLLVSNANKTSDLHQCLNCQEFLCSPLSVKSCTQTHGFGFKLVFVIALLPPLFWS